MVKVRGNPRRSLVIGMTSLILAAVLAGCTTSVPGPTPAANSVPSASQAANAAQSDRPLVVALSSEPTNLNPMFLDINAGNWKVFSGLLKYDKDLKLVPDLAASMPEVSADSRTITVRLRDNVKFHDGQPFSAKDVVFTYQSILDPKVATAVRSTLDIGSIREVKALDNLTVQFSLSREDPAFLHKLYIGITPHHLLEGKDLNSAEFNKQPIGTGPYVFKEWRAGDRLVFEANPGYYGGEPAIKRVVFTWAPTDNARAALLTNGTVDFARLVAPLANNFRNDPRYKVHEISTDVADLVVLPNEHPFLKELPVRRAIALAVNREEMARGVLQGAGDVAHGPMRPEHWAFNPDVRSQFDAARAVELLEQAGWKDADGDGVREKGGVKAAFTLMYLASQSEHKDLALAARSDLARIGIDVNVEGVQSPGYESRLKTDAWIHNLGQPYDPDLDMWVRFHSRFAVDDNPSTNMANMRDAEVDRALEEGRSTLDQNKRREAYLRLQKAVVDDASHLFLTRRKLFAVGPGGIEGIVPQVQASGHAFLRGVSYNLEEWRWAQ